MTLPESATPVVLQPGEGKSVQLGSGGRCTFKVVGADTAGHFGLFEYTMEPGAGGAAPHIHREMVEIFYIAQGEVELIVGDQKTVGRPGTVALIPRGTPHAFAQAGPQRSVLLIMFCPADAREQYFEGLAELTRGGQRPDPEALLELMREYDQKPALGHWLGDEGYRGLFELMRKYDQEPV